MEKKLTANHENGWQRDVHWTAHRISAKEIASMAI